MKPVKVITLAALGAMGGLLMSGLWLMQQDANTICEGGCSTADKSHIPPTDITLMVGAVGGALIVLALLWIDRATLRRRQRKQAELRQ